MKNAVRTYYYQNETALTFKSCDKAHHIRNIQQLSAEQRIVTERFLLKIPSQYMALDY